jgi:hypothetical protein
VILSSVQLSPTLIILYISSLSQLPVYSSISSPPRFLLHCASTPLLLRLPSPHHRHPSFYPSIVGVGWSQRSARCAWSQHHTAAGRLHPSGRMHPRRCRHQLHLISPSLPSIPPRLPAIHDGHPPYYLWPPPNKLRH